MKHRMKNNNVVITEKKKRNNNILKLLLFIHKSQSSLCISILQESNIQEACQASGNTKNEHGLLNASLVEHPLDYLASLLNTAGVSIQYSECKVNTMGIQNLTRI